MNGIQFFAAQLEADERFRNALEIFMKQFEVQNGKDIQEDNGEGQLGDGDGESDVSSGNIGS